MRNDDDLDEPVFILCAARSGSTLLRFLVDAHPDLACPPEGNVPALCGQMATVWSLIEGSPLSVERDGDLPEITPSTITGVRGMLNAMLRAYLARRGKRRYCDKSLGTARFADLLVQMYPEIKFLCLYRHPMDMIASGLEACPWGLNGYGFEPYNASSPGNEILALARYWVDNTKGILDVEKRYPERCFRIRYEDVVYDPESVSSDVFTFLGMESVPGISKKCFEEQPERFGPADHKIWYTSEISYRSVGRGWSLPVSMISPTVLSSLNQLASELDYVIVDESWGATAPPGDVRANRPTSCIQESDLFTISETANSLAKRLRSGLSRYDSEAAKENFVVVCVDSPYSSHYWLVNMATRSVVAADASAQDTSDWDIIASCSVWARILSEDLNLSSALRSSELRYCESVQSGSVITTNRIKILARLLGLFG